MTTIGGIKFEQTEDTWTNPDGKVIPFTRFEHLLTEYQNEFCALSISITKWPSNTSIEVIEIDGDCEPDTDSWDRYTETHIHRIGKLPHADFEEKQEELILKAKKFAHKIYVRNTGDCELSYFE